MWHKFHFQEQETMWKYRSQPKTEPVMSLPDF